MSRRLSTKARAWLPSAPRSFGAVLDDTRGIGQGFDLLRVLLSLSILCWHSICITYGFAAERVAWATPLGTLAATLLPLFFALSGFLVMGSALRVRSLATFISFRMLRILPALSTEVCLAAVLIGGLSTSFSPGAYYTSAGFFRYFANILGDITFFLPGVFEKNPENTVNASLWTIPPEIFCYIFLALMILSDGYRRRWIYVIVFACLFALNTVVEQHVTPGIPAIGAGPVRVYHLFLAFVIGNLFYQFRYTIPCHIVLFVVAALLSFLLLRVQGFVNFSLITITYCVVYLGLINIPKIPLLSRGDYSYGIYLYAYPIQQLVTMLLPGLRVWWVNILFSIPFSIIFAALSWHFIELPALALKDRLKFLRTREVSWLQSYGFRFSLASTLAMFGLVLLHWSNLDAATGYSFRTHWFSVAVVLPVIILLVAGLPKRRATAIPAPASADR